MNILLFALATCTIVLHRLSVLAICRTTQINRYGMV